MEAQQIELDWVARLEQFKATLTPEDFIRTPRPVGPVVAREPRVIVPPQPKPDYSADRCRKAADAMTPHIEAKHASASAMLSKPPTRKRLNDAEGIRKDALFLEKVQRTLYVLAEMHEVGNCPAELRGIVSRAAVERERRNIPALRELMESSAAVETRADKVRRLESEAKLAGIPGFFATPRELANEVTRLAGPIRPGAKVFEPGAGSGSLIDAVLWVQPDADISYCEISSRLRSLLVLKYENQGNIRLLADSLDEITPTSGARFDLVVMNPPFEKSVDMQHVLAAWELLKPGGVLVSILSEGVFFRGDTMSTMFRSWMDRNAAEVVDIPAGAFRSSGTGVKSRMIRVSDWIGKGRENNRIEEIEQLVKAPG